MILTFPKRNMKELIQSLYVPIPTKIKRAFSKVDISHYGHMQKRLRSVLLEALYSLISLTPLMSRCAFSLLIVFER